nr:YraN family protein [Saprospiraceae bacterium]
MSKKTGDWGEQIAVRFLNSMGVHILHQNWRSGHCELDIVGIEGNTLIFYEVKVRKYDSPTDMFDAIGVDQMRTLAKAASDYMQIYELEGEVRFDLIGITYYDKTNYTIDHKMDVFFPA